MGQDKQAPKQETLHMPMKQHHSLSLLHFWHSAVINCIESDLLCSFLAVRSKGKLIDAALLKPGFLLAVTNMHNSQGMARMGFENNKEYLVWRFPGFPVKHLSSHYSVFHQLQQETYIHSISVYSMYIYIYIPDTNWAGFQTSGRWLEHFAGAREVRPRRKEFQTIPMAAGPLCPFHDTWVAYSASTCKVWIALLAFLNPCPLALRYFLSALLQSPTANKLSRLIILPFWVPLHDLCRSAVWRQLLLLLLARSNCGDFVRNQQMWTLCCLIVCFLRSHVKYRQIISIQSNPINWRCSGPSGWLFDSMSQVTGNQT